MNVPKFGPLPWNPEPSDRHDYFGHAAVVVAVVVIVAAAYVCGHDVCFGGRRGGQHYFSLILTYKPYTSGSLLAQVNIDC